MMNGMCSDHATIFHFFALQPLEGRMLICSYQTLTPCAGLKLKRVLWALWESFSVFHSAVIQVLHMAM